MKRPHGGLLWDSLSPNMGDIAAGTAVRRLLAARGIELDPLSIVDGMALEHDVLVIGGGELLQPPWHPFYDLFRVPGAHVLCPVGTSGPQPGQHLAGYRLAAVRSAGDLANLEGAGDVEVAPCLTVLFDRIARSAGELPAGIAGSLGLHLHPAAVPQEVGQLVEPLRQLAEAGDCRLLSLTRYNQDLLLGEALSQLLNMRPPVEALDPDFAFAVIRSLKALVCTSLHATVFAYVAGVPFLSVGYSPKVTSFLSERGLEARLVGSLAEAASRSELLAQGSVDWQDHLAADQGSAERYVARMADVLQAPTPSPPPPWKPPTHPASGHALMMSVYREYGRRVVDKVRYEHTYAILENFHYATKALLDACEEERHRLAAQGGVDSTAGPGSAAGAPPRPGWLRRVFGRD